MRTPGVFFDGWVAPSFAVMAFLALEPTHVGSLQGFLADITTGGEVISSRDSPGGQPWDTRR
jgi:hypothetical protein